VVSIPRSIITPKMMRTLGKKVAAPGGPPTSAKALNPKVAIIAPALPLAAEIP
jgi:hypothetical protein